MTVIEQFAEEGIDARRFEYEDGVVLAADFGPAADASVDVVGDTAIVVAGGEQYDFAVGADAQAFMRNGVLTIEGDE
jgi:hypothetical protein